MAKVTELWHTPSLSLCHCRDVVNRRLEESDRPTYHSDPELGHAAEMWRHEGRLSPTSLSCNIYPHGEQHAPLKRLEHYSEAKKTAKQCYS